MLEHDLCHDETKWPFCSIPSIIMKIENSSNRWKLKSPTDINEDMCDTCNKKLQNTLTRSKLHQ